MPSVALIPLHQFLLLLHFKRKWKVKLCFISKPKTAPVRYSSPLFKFSCPKSMRSLLSSRIHISTLHWRPSGLGIIITFNNAICILMLKMELFFYVLSLQLSEQGSCGKDGCRSIKIHTSLLCSPWQLSSPSLFHLRTLFFNKDNELKVKTSLKCP